jgi:SAM-dependent methyltransferase
VKHDPLDPVNPLTHRRSYFDEMYRTDDDPWSFQTSWYEKRKRDVTLAALPNERYRRCVEPGCSLGMLTERLADRAAEVIAFDFVADVVALARRRVDRANVTICEAEFPDYWPTGTGDLVVWSEVAYYLTDSGLDVAMRGLDRWLDPGGHLVAVHYTARTDYPQAGQQVAVRIDQHPDLRRVTTLVDPTFELGVWERTAD